MNIEEAIEKALDGDAIIFTGAGFSTGATNARSKPIPTGKPFAQQLMMKLGVKEKELSLEYAAEAFVSDRGKDALIAEVEEQFYCTHIENHHIEIAKVPWKRVYTANYDDVMETAYKQNSRILISVTPSNDIYKTPKNQTLCVHFNGYVQTLDRDKIVDEVKLTVSSYLSESVVNSSWAFDFRSNLKLARAVFFVGYSLSDLDIRRLLVNSPQLKEKCFFILGPSPNKLTKQLAELFGAPEIISAQQFADAIKKKKRNYKPSGRQMRPTISVPEYKPPIINYVSKKSISDQDFIDLLLYGRITEEKVSESIGSNTPYFLERNAALKRLFDLIDEGKPIINIVSELGNGKSLFLEELRFRAKEHGFRIFEAKEHNAEAAADLQIIAQIPEKVIVTIEEYQNWKEEIRLFRQNAKDRAYLVLTARTSVNDIFIDELADITGLDSIGTINLDTLEENEIKWFADALSHYGLWGANTAKSQTAKLNILRRKCQSQIYLILIEVLKSQQIQERIKRLCDELKTNQQNYEIILSVFILNLLKPMPTIDILVDIWGTDAISSMRSPKNHTIRSLIDFEHHQVVAKSPILAQHILRNIADPAITVKVLTKMARHANIGRTPAPGLYRDMMNNLVKSSNVQSVLPAERPAAALISYYESIKTLSTIKNHPHFWLQYGISCIAIKDYIRANKYFEAAYSLASSISGYETRQIDNHFARLLLEEAYEDNWEHEKAMDNFRKSRNIITQQMKAERMYYPYRVANHYRPFLDHFRTSLTHKELIEIRNAAQKVLERASSLSEPLKLNRYVNECIKSMEYVVSEANDILRRNATSSST